MKKELYTLGGMSLLALIVKLLLSPAVVYQYDLYSFAAWALALGQEGLVKSYEIVLDSSLSEINYPPGAMYLFTVLGWLVKTFSLTGFVWQGLLKLPAILFDLALALATYFIFRKKYSKAKALIPFFLALANPAAWFNSSFWGGVDSWHTFFVLISFYYLTEKKYLLTGILMTVACLLKPQALIFWPLLGIFLIKEAGWLKTIKAGLASLASGIIICLPWLITGKGEQIFKIMTGYVGYYQRLSSLAFNIWYLIFGYNSWAINDQEHGLRYLGLVLFFMIYLVVLGWIWKQKKDLYFLVWFSATIIGLSFFLFCTEIHERYLFQTVPLVLMLYYYGKKVRYFYVYFALAVFINAALALVFMQQPNLGEIGRILSATNLVAGGLFVYYGLRHWYPPSSKV